MDPHHSTTGEPHGNPHDGIDASLFHIIVGMFYLILAGTSAVRLIQKLRETGLAVPEKVRHTLHVVVAVTLYSAVRALELLLLGVGVISFRGGKDFYAIVPNMFMLLMQSAFVAKWVSHVSEVTLALQNTRFFRGFAAVVVSLVIWVAVSLLIGVAAISTAIGRSPLSVEDWYYAINISSCVGYMGNGVVFVVLGLTLRSLWRPATDDGASVARRVLGIAVLFGLVCISRGVILCIYTVDARQEAQNVTHSSWGIPTVMLVEWAGLIAVMALLTRRGGSGSSSGGGGGGAGDNGEGGSEYDGDRQSSLLNDGAYSDGHESDGEGYRSDGAASNNSSARASNGSGSARLLSPSHERARRSDRRRVANIESESTRLVPNSNGGGVGNATAAAFGGGAGASHHHHGGSRRSARRMDDYQAAGTSGVARVRLGPSAPSLSVNAAGATGATVAAHQADSVSSSVEMQRPMGGT